MWGIPLHNQWGISGVVILYHEGCRRSSSQITLGFLIRIVVKCSCVPYAGLDQWTYTWWSDCQLEGVRKRGFRKESWFKTLISPSSGKAIFINHVLQTQNIVQQTKNSINYSTNIIGIRRRKAFSRVGLLLNCKIKKLKFNTHCPWPMSWDNESTWE